MERKQLYKRIKSELLKDENISKVYINSARRLVKVEPSRKQYYVLISDPLKNFKADNCFEICNTTFKLCNYICNSDYYEIDLKEMC
ncbi:MAG: hypothetical protein E7213_08490 [Clostridium sp.]|nr:hypothetical protein [Clostridium sp.]